MLSIKPRYADKITEGSKTVELRRTAPDLQPDAAVFLYSSSPVKQIVGSATLERVVEHTPAELWRLASINAGVTSTEFDKYFEGTDRAYGLQLKNVRVASVRVDLAKMRMLGVEPPQSWRYIDSDLAQRLICLMR